MPAARATALILSLVASAFAGSSVLAAEEDCRQLRPGDQDSPIVCRQQSWFHAAATPISNIGAVPGQANPSWSTTPPAEDGAGAIALGESYLGVILTGGEDYVNELVFEGTFTGNLDRIAISLHVEQPTWAICQLPSVSCSGRDAFAVTLTVDGHVLYETENFSDSVPFDIDAISQRMDFGFTGLYDLLAAQGISHPGFVHAIKLTIAPHNAHAGVVYRYDSADFPSGLVFNPTPEELAGYEVVND